MDADLIVRGPILTMDAQRPTARALAARGGAILAVGTESQANRWRGTRARVWTLRHGQVVVPGFVDSHAHLATDAWRRTWVDLGGCPSLAEALLLLRARARRAGRGEWIIGRGWDESAWPENRYLTRRDLDRVSLRHPVLANRVDGHLCSVNSAALRQTGIAAGGSGVEVADGRLTGVLKEWAAERAREAIPPPSEARLADLLEDAIGHVHAMGITNVHDIVDVRHIRAYERLRRQGRLAIRVYLMPYVDLLDGFEATGLRTGFGDAWLRLGAVKVFADGSLGARTAALSKPYADDPRARGRLLLSQKALAKVLEKAHGAGFQLAVHAIGDRAVDAVIDAFGRVLDREPRGDHRHRVEHLELPTDEHLDLAAGLGLVPSMQPNFVARWSRPGGLYERRLGPDRLRGNNPFRGILDGGIALAFGSDGMPYGPLYGLEGAVAAPFEGQRIAAEDALQCYTVHGARASFSEGEVGRLAAGLLADFVVLSGDPRRRSGIAALTVEATVVGGRVVYRRGRRHPPGRARPDLDSGVGDGRGRAGANHLLGRTP